MHRTVRTARSLALFGAIALGARSLDAQAPTFTAPKLKATTPAGCLQEASDWRSAQLQPIVATLQSAPADKRADAMTVYRAAYPAAVKEAVRAAKECASQFDLERISTSQLVDLVNLYSFVEDSVSRRRATTRVLAATDLPPRPKANALLLAMREAITESGSYFGIIDKAETFVKQIDAMPDSLNDVKISAHQTMMGRYEYLDVAEGLRTHSSAILSLARKPSSDPKANTPAATKARLSTMASAYHSLARAAADMLHPDSAMLILDKAEAELGAESKPIFADFRNRYALIGAKAEAVTGQWWLNSADNAPVRMDDGKVHIVEFTAHWCVPCRNSYPGVKALGERFKGAPFEGTMVTSLYGYLGDKKGLTPEQEVDADREYFGKEHALPYRMAINPQPKQIPGAPFQQPKPDMDYRVGGIPQFVIIDRKGVIRQIVTGWDQGNGKRFSDYIAALITEGTKQ